MQHKLIYSLIGAIALLVSAGPALAERHPIIQYGAAIYVVDVDRLGGSMLAGRYMGVRIIELWPKRGDLN